MSLPGLSEIEGASWDYLTTAAENWNKLADKWEQTFTEVRTQSMHPGGTEWTGTGADAAQARTDGDMMRVRGPAKPLRDAAKIATRSRDQQEAGKRTLASTVEDVRTDGFNVAEDYHVTPTTPDYSSSESLMAQINTAAEHEQYIKSQVTRLVEGEHDLSRQLTTATQDLDTFAFPADVGEDGGAGAAGTPHTSGLVDDVLKPGQSRNLGPVAGTGAHPGIPGIGAADLGEVVTLPNGQKVAIFGDAWTGNRVGEGEHYPSVAVPVTYDAQGRPHYGPPLTGTEGSNVLFPMPAEASRAGAKNTLPAGTIRMNNGDTYMLVAGTDVIDGHLVPKGGSWLVKVTDTPGQGWGMIPNSWNEWAPNSPTGVPTQISGFQSSKDGMVYIAADSFARSDGVSMYRFDPTHFTNPDPSLGIGNRSNWQPWTGNDWGANGQTPANMSGDHNFGELSFQEVQGQPVLSGFNVSDGPGAVEIRVANSPTDIFSDSTPTVVAQNGPGNTPTSVWQPYGGYILPGSTLDNMNILVSQWDTRPASNGAPYNSQEFQVNPYH